MRWNRKSDVIGTAMSFEKSAGSEPSMRPQEVWVWALGVMRSQLVVEGGEGGGGAVIHPNSFFLGVID